MNNIKLHLSDKVLITFHELYPDVIISDQLKNLLQVLYFGKFNIDYQVKSLIAVQKLMSSQGITIDINTLGNQLASRLDANYFSNVIDRNALNINLTNNYVIDQIKNMYNCDNIFSDQCAKSRGIKVLVDFSSPNIAKDMHVGHLRSTIIGDSISTLHEILGYEVHRINHIGDFGLQFGMIIQHLLEIYPTKEAYLNSGLSIKDLQQFYKDSKKRFDNDLEFNKAAYNKVVLLQSGDTFINDAWNYIKDISRLAYNDIYGKLNINLDEVGESFYQSMIPNVIDELTSKGLVQTIDGRKVIVVPGYKEVLTVQKSDGGFTYDTTDLAAIRYRLVDLNMDKILYVIDNGQSLHCTLFFKVAELAGWKQPHQIVKHIGFGLVLGEDGKKLKSRDGDTVKLNDLLSESIVKAKTVLDEHRGKTDTVLSNEARNNIVNTIAYGSLKYADLSSIRTNNYQFSYDRMISFKGNTGTYQLYEYVRICTILENAHEYLDGISGYIDDFSISEKEEINVSKIILQFPEIIDKIADDVMFHTLCSYLYELSNAFCSFHTKCRCIHYNKTDKTIQYVDYNRLIICQMTKMIMEQCFKILGIQTIQKM